MKYFALLLLASWSLGAVSQNTLGGNQTMQAEILIIAHRGASGHLPEQTLAAYELAIKQGADYIEPDLVITKDKVLIARHEPEISETTDVAQKFPQRKTTKIIEGQKVTGWFAEDFTLKEIKTLRAKERLASRSQAHNGKYEIPTLDEIFDLIEKNRKANRTLGIIPEIKHPQYFRSQNLSLEPLLAELLKKRGWAKMNLPIYVQSFELESLKSLKKLIPVKTVFLMYGTSGEPRDLKLIAKSADAIGPYKRMILPEKKEGGLASPTSLVEDAHRVGLKVFPYTFRSDKEFLAEEYENEPAKELKQFFKLKVDGVFTDFPDHAIKARKEFLTKP